MSLENQYENLSKIGSGSFGHIYKVRRKADGFVMCRKEIAYAKMGQQERAQLHAEFSILSSLRHPNIVAFYDREHLKQSQDLHLYMEYCPNGDLGQYIKDLKVRSSRAPEPFVWGIFTQLMLALYRCHYGVSPPEVGSGLFRFNKKDAVRPDVPHGTMTILHRDLKPENVFLDESNNVKLGDFGLSKKLASTDFAKTYVGTPYYMSPEICAGELYTLKSDIWSLGCIMYELCSREPPFNAKTQWHLISKIKEGKVARLPEMYSEDLFSVIKECLKVNPDQRPDTATLLNIPIVRMMRKEKEMLDMQEMLQAKLDATDRMQKEVEDRLADLEKEKTTLRAEIDASCHREWEVKARLEIDRQSALEVERLRKLFEVEVRTRVEAAVQEKMASLPQAQEPKAEIIATISSDQHVSSLPRIDDQPRPRSQTHALGPISEHARPNKESFSSVSKADFPQSSIGSTSGDEFPSTTDITEYESPEPAKEVKNKLSNRTPFGRAHTMFAGNANTPMDICASPTINDMGIGALSLSPRRNGNTKPPQLHTNNIFAVNAADKPATTWTVPNSGAFDDSDLGSDDDFSPPSPTRHVKSSKNPFTSKSRPVLTSQKTAPVPRVKPVSTSGLPSKLGRLDSETTQRHVSDPSLRATSPNRRLSKIPSAVNLQENPTTGLPSKVGALDRKKSIEALGKVAAKNNIKGRTLVELQQARAGGRPVSVVVNQGANVSPKRGYPHRPRSASDDDVAVWDPSRDEMPSPFLRRCKDVKGY